MKAIAFAIIRGAKETDESCLVGFLYAVEIVRLGAEGFPFGSRSEW